MNYWPFWLGGIALAGVAVLHWVVVGRMLAVSGRVTQLVNRLRFGRRDAGVEEMTADDLAEALRQATLAEFGPSVVEPPPAEPSPAAAAAAAPAAAAPDARTLEALWRSPSPLVAHVLFFGGLVLGGAVSSWQAGAGHITATLHGETFARLTGGSPVASCVLLLLSGAFIGFGTRMAGGCTSGHGLCGVSRFQLGSLVTTAAFFGIGVVTSLVVGRLL